MEKDEIIQLLKSKDIEDRKLGVILLSRVCDDRNTFKKTIAALVGANGSEDDGTTACIYHTSDWDIRIYVGDKGFFVGLAATHTLQESIHDYGTDVERYELDI